MGNVLIFIPKNCENVHPIKKTKKEERNYTKLLEENAQLEELIAIKEDMIANVSLANPDEIEHECDDGFVMTKSGEVKWNPKFSEDYNYIINKKNKIRMNHLDLKRKENIQLVK